MASRLLCRTCLSFYGAPSPPCDLAFSGDSAIFVAAVWSGEPGWMLSATSCMVWSSTFSVGMSCALDMLAWTFLSCCYLFY